MKIRKLFLILIACACLSAVVGVTRSSDLSSVSSQDISEQIASLLKQLVIADIRTEFPELPLVRRQVPNQELQEHVQSELFKIGQQSDEARSEVIHALIRIVDDSVTRNESLETYRWITAVRVLGDLRAVEAIDVLIKNLDESGSYPLLIKGNSTPAQSALGKIGKPAIPHLIEALSNQKQEIRQNAINALTRMGWTAVPQLIEALSHANPSIRGGAALALGWIGGQENISAIENSLKTETNAEAKADFEYALNAARRKF
jgi:HEAT repeat protein